MQVIRRVLAVLLVLVLSGTLSWAGGDERPVGGGVQGERRARATAGSMASRVVLPVLFRGCSNLARLSDEFASPGLDGDRWAVLHGEPSVSGGELLLPAGSDVQSREAVRFVTVQIVARSADWRPHEADTDSSLGLEMWSGGNGQCHDGIVLKGNGHLGVLCAHPDADGGCTGDPQEQFYTPIPNWERLRAASRLFIEIRWSANGVRLRVHDGASTVGEVSYLGQAMPMAPSKVRLYAAPGEAYAIEQVRVQGHLEILPEEGTYQGAILPGLPPSDPSLIDEFERQAGKGLGVIKAYQHLHNGHFYTNWADLIAQRGAIEFLSLDPTTAAGDLTPCEVLSGEYDEAIRTFAREIGDWGQPLLLSMAGEMNGTWAGWSGARNFGPDCSQTYSETEDLYGAYGCSERTAACADGPERYRAMARHLHDLFERECTRNVLWVWVVNHESWPPTAEAAWNAAANYNPGPGYVDVIAVDGYNWGDDGPGGCPVDAGWKSFGEVLSPMLTDLTARYPGVPLMIGEYASVEGSRSGEDKAAWIRDAYEQIRTHWPPIKAVVWYNLPGDCSFELAGSSMDAYRQAIGDCRYMGGRSRGACPGSR